MFIKVSRKKGVTNIEGRPYLTDEQIATWRKTRPDVADGRMYGRTNGDSLTFNVCESYRNDEGKPRQRKVMYLGTVREGRFDEARNGESEPFDAWTITNKLMDSDLTESDKRDLIVKLAKHIPPFSTSDLEAYMDKARAKANDKDNPYAAMWAGHTLPDYLYTIAGWM